ncbi:MAG: hypothetical protein S4CHLAM102_12510 [Chlamydiia bacterium]|nr:hypothetical protein [Chlamydiia bacterium]
MEVKLKYALFVGLFFIGISPSISYSGGRSDVSKRESAVDKVLLKAAKTIEKEIGIDCIGTGGGTMHGVEMLSLSFQQNGELDIPSARVKIVKAGEIFLEEINSCKELRKYLIPCPFTPKNIEICILVFDVNRNNLPFDKLQCVSTNKGTVKYRVDSPDRNTFCVVEKETYEEAREKILIQPEVIVESK